MNKIKLYNAAVNDLKEAKNYISKELCNEQAAVNVIGKITKQIYTLGKFPNSGTPLSSIIKFNTDYRFIVCENYTVFYRVNDKTVYVVRVLYSKRNFMSVLFGDFQD